MAVFFWDGSSGWLPSTSSWEEGEEGEEEERYVLNCSDVEPAEEDNGGDEEAFAPP